MNVTNMFDDCELGIDVDLYIKKIRQVICDNFNINICFANPIKEYKNNTIILDRKTGDLFMKQRHVYDKNSLNTDRMVCVHYIIQVAVWIIYNSLHDQPKILSMVFDNFYDYMFGPILTSIIFNYNKNKVYMSEIPSVYLNMVPIATNLSFST